jgi:DNA-binding NarL/FixJ family response regulator
VGYLLKEKIADVNVISDAVRRVAAGESVFDSDVIARLIGRRHAAGGPLDGLTPREYEVLSLMAQGFSNFGIAARLVVTVPAVERHVTGIFAKLKLDQSYRAQHRRVSAVLAFLNASE